MEIKKGDWIRTPRFCTVQIKEVYDTEEEARSDGFTEPTHYRDGSCGILGKNIAVNRMVFAAYRK